MAYSFHPSLKLLFVLVHQRSTAAVKSRQIAIMASLPTPTPIHGTLRPPKRRHAYDSRPQASPKRPRPSPDCSDLDCSTPGSDAPYITSDRGSPVPRSPAREGSFPSLNDDLEEEDDSTGGLGEEIEVMDWERNDEAEREICYGAVSIKSARSYIYLFTYLAIEIVNNRILDLRSSGTIPTENGCL